MIDNTCLPRCHSCNSSLCTTTMSEIEKYCIHVLLPCIIHCCVGLEICIKQEISINSSKIHPTPRVRFNHASQTRTTHMFHARFLITYTMRNRIVAFSLKFYSGLHDLSALCFIDVRLLYLCTPRSLTHPAFCNGKFYGLIAGNHCS